MADDQPRYLKVAEAAARLSVTPRFIQKQIADGKLRAHRVSDSERIVRVRADDLEALVRPK